MTQIQLDDSQRQALATLLAALTAPPAKPEPQSDNAAQGASAPPPAGPAHAGTPDSAGRRGGALGLALEEVERLRAELAARDARPVAPDVAAFQRPEPLPGWPQPAELSHEPADLRAEARPQPAPDWHQTRGWRRLLYVLPLALISLPLAYIVFAGAPAGAGDYKHVIYAWSLLKILTFGVAGAALDWCLSPRDQPEDLDGIAQGAAWKRRAVIVAAGVIAGAVSP
jgi:hypothetical protein